MFMFKFQQINFIYLVYVKLHVYHLIIDFDKMLMRDEERHYYSSLDWGDSHCIHSLCRAASVEY